MRNERTMTSTTPNELGKLTNLLATEDIAVEHRKVHTASFDVKARVLTLPIWKDMTKELYHLLVLHEVGHALYTPEEDWIKSVKDDKNLKGYINIVEDARIERMMKIKYPGSRRDFVIGYKEIYDRDIFGVKYKEIDAMNFIDRVNLSFKLGSSMDIQFTDEEQSFVDRCETTRTFDDVVSLSQEMLAYAKDGAELDENAFGENAFGDGEFAEFSDDEGDSSGSEGSEESDKSDESEGSGTGGSGKGESEESDDYTPEDDGLCPSSPAIRGGVGCDDGVTATTDENYNKNMVDQMVDREAIPSNYIVLDKSVDYKPYIVNNEKIRDLIRRHRDLWRENDKDQKVGDWDTETERRYTEFCINNKKNVAYLVKEFEMKKAADQYSRSKDAKTGVIDPNKLHSYKFTDTIFKRLTVVPDAKNHGLMMYIDFSGSMAENMLGTTEQLLNLVMFCRKVNIPHRVYGFTDSLRLVDRVTGMDARDEIPSTADRNIGKAFSTSASGSYLMELYTEKMNNSAFVEMTKYLLDYAGHCDCRYYRYARSKYQTQDESWQPFVFTLGGTPLNSTLLLVRNMINDFKKDTSAQVVNLVFLTDGESHPLVYNPHACGGKHWRAINVIRDPITKVEGRVRRSRDETKILLKIIRQSCDVNAINFFICVSNRLPHVVWGLINGTDDKKANPALYHSWKAAEVFRSLWRKDNAITIKETQGFSEVHLIAGGASLRSEGTGLEGIEVGEKRGVMTRAFIKANTKRKMSRVVLSKFIDRIAA